MNQDPHAVLGVPRGVSVAALKAAFRTRARATHPDHGGDRAQFEAVVAAFEALLPEVGATADPIVVDVRGPSTHARRDSRWLGGDDRTGPRFSAYDSPRPAAPTPRRPVTPDFGAVLAGVMARQAA